MPPTTSEYPYLLDLTTGEEHKPVQFSFDDTYFVYNDLSTHYSPDVHVPLSHVLSADISDSIVHVNVIEKSRSGPKLIKLSGSFQADNAVTRSSANDWVQAAMSAAYTGVKMQRRLLIVINPNGGPGRATSDFEHKVEPILKAARCTYEVVHTKHRGHAANIASEIQLDDYDAVVAVSGDGTLHEIVNGFAQHKEPMRAFKMPIAVIPAGSGNGMSLNLMGADDGLDVTVATLNAIKGRPMAIDLLSILQNDKRTFSFLSQCVGLMADLDLGTEHLRWMGSARFVYGFLRGILTRKAYRFAISVKTEMSEKGAMVKALREYTSSAPHFDVPREGEQNATALPPLRYVDEHEGWTTFEGPILFMYAGKGPLVSRDLMQFPVAVPNDGMVDIVVQGRMSRFEMLTSFDGAESGATYWMDKAQYLKATAYRLRPMQEDGNLSIDGERFPFKEYYAEVHRGLATVLSMNGRYPVDFTLEHPGSA